MGVSSVKSSNQTMYGDASPMPVSLSVVWPTGASTQSSSATTGQLRHIRAPAHEAVPGGAQRSSSCQRAAKALLKNLTRPSGP